MTLGKATTFLIVALALPLFQTEWQCQGQTNNAADHPLWPLFAELMSAQFGRTVQDINVLGLNDPFINTLWNSYKAAMPSLTAPTQAQTTTTPAPPMPDIYQASYSFSSNTAAQQQKEQQQQQQTELNNMYNQVLSLMNPASSSQTSQVSNTGSGASMQDVMAAYQNLASGMLGSSQPQPQTQPQDAMAMYNQLMAATGQSPSAATNTGSGSTMTAQDMMDLYNQMSAMTATGNAGSQAATPSAYDQLQQLQTLMAQSNSATSSNSYQPTAQPSSSTSTSQDQILQMYNQIMNTGGQSSLPTTSSSSLTHSSSTNTAPSSMTFEQQMAQLLNQASAPAASPPTPSPPIDTLSSNITDLIYNDSVPVTSPDQGSSSSSSSSSSTSPGSNGLSTSSSAVQNIFDMFLFGNKPAGQPQPGSMGGSPMSGGNLISSHMENTFKARASRDMGCRFLPELLELEVLPTVPLDCRNKCPFPYINAKKFGVYCVCCPVGITDEVVGAMSLLRRQKYLTDNPMAVIS